MYIFVMHVCIVLSEPRMEQNLEQQYAVKFQLPKLSIWSLRPEVMLPLVVQLYLMVQIVLWGADLMKDDRHIGLSCLSATVFMDNSLVRVEVFFCYSDLWLSVCRVAGLLGMSYCNVRRNITENLNMRRFVLSLFLKS